MLFGGARLPEMIWYPVAGTLRFSPIGDRLQVTDALGAGAGRNTLRLHRAAQSLESPLVSDSFGIENGLQNLAMVVALFASLGAGHAERRTVQVAHFGGDHG